MIFGGLEMDDNDSARQKDANLRRIYRRIPRYNEY